MSSHDSNKVAIHMRIPSRASDEDLNKEQHIEQVSLEVPMILKLEFRFVMVRIIILSCGEN